MCGIVGAFAFGKPDVDKEKEQIRQEAIIFLTTELLQQTQSRGKDATGVATLFDNGMYIGLKSGIDAVSFISSRGGKKTDYAGYLKIWRHRLRIKQHKYARIHIGHCRKSSVGNSDNNDNNHPIVVDPIIGIHNGTLKNHDLIFKKLNCGRTGTVDSEAIMRLVYHFTEGGKRPFTIDLLKEVGNRLDGSFATIIMNANNPYQVALMRDMRPIEMLLIRPLNLVLIASETSFLDISIFRYNKYVSLYNMNTKLPALKKTDLDSKMLENDGLAVFDLTREISSNTKLVDLYSSGKLVFGDRTWKAPYSSTSSYHSGNSLYGNSNTSNYYTGAQAAGAYTRANSRKTNSNTASSKAPGPVGKVWNKKLNAFEDANINIEDTDNKGNVTVNVETGEINSVNLTRVDNADKALVTSVPRIKTESVGTESVGTESVGTESVGAADKSKDGTTSKMVVEEVDMTVNTKALEEAERASKTVKQYDTDAEVTSDLELSDERVLKNLPPVSLANRIKKFVYKLGFYDGYCKAEESLATSNAAVCKVTDIKDLKARKQERNIRVLKAMTKFIGHIADDVINDKNVIRLAVSNNYPKWSTENITVNSVMNVLKAGDIRGSVTLKEFITKVQQEEVKK